MKISDQFSKFLSKIYIFSFCIKKNINLIILKIVTKEKVPQNNKNI